jgi:hypothetical protein
MVSHQDQRRHLDLLFLIDAVVSLAFGVAALLSPHGLLQKIGGGEKICLSIGCHWRDRETFSPFVHDADLSCMLQENTTTAHMKS